MSDHFKVLRSVDLELSKTMSSMSMPNQNNGSKSSDQKSDRPLMLLSLHTDNDNIILKFYDDIEHEVVPINMGKYKPYYFIKDEKEETEKRPTKRQYATC